MLAFKGRLLGQPMTYAVGVSANEWQGPNRPWRITFLVAALQDAGFSRGGAIVITNFRVVFFSLSFPSSTFDPLRGNSRV